MIVRSRDPLVAIALAIAMIAGGMPNIEIRIRPHSRPAMTLNICHPLQAVNSVAAPCGLSAVRAEAIVREPEPAETVVKLAAPIKTRPAESPDPPPPKTLA